MGQRVVLSGQFLIDSEASLRGLEAQLNQELTPTSTSRQQRYTTEAVIDALSGDTVTLTHPPIPALKWPQMQMGFQLPPRSEQPRDLKAGDRLQIEFEMQDGQVPRITSLQRVAPEAGK
ncbi:copper-binding protein [Hydrogenophaga sp. ANAO-22]|uniref:copper-binding protein n=1 Tax=Hydrogenophaga sp. ANAO-22 TaxID=3166645 RepID=UPI0036D32876